jgi:hypothetical protein
MVRVIVCKVWPNLFPQVKHHSDLSALPSRAPHDAFASKALEPVFKIVQPILPWRPLPLRQPSPVVFNDDCELVFLTAQAKPDFRGSRMADDIVQGFLYRQEKMMPCLG